MYSINFTWNECLSINYNIIHLIQCSVNQTKNSNSGVILQLSQVAYWSRQKQEDKHFIGFLSTVVSERIQTQKVVNKFNWFFFFFFLLIVLAILIIYNVQLANIQKKNQTLLYYFIERFRFRSRDIEPCLFEISESILTWTTKLLWMIDLCL